MKKIMVAVAVILVAGCKPIERTYKVTYKDGNYEYYNLNYRPKSNAKSIEYEGQTILGVESIEYVK